MCFRWGVRRFELHSLFLSLLCSLGHFTSRLSVASLPSEITSYFRKSLHNKKRKKNPELKHSSYDFIAYSHSYLFKFFKQSCNHSLHLILKPASSLNLPLFTFFIGSIWLVLPLLRGRSHSLLSIAVYNLLLKFSVFTVYSWTDILVACF